LHLILIRAVSNFYSCLLKICEPHQTRLTGLLHFERVILP
jgi:hypothetical protein